MDLPCVLLLILVILLLPLHRMVSYYWRKPRVPEKETKAVLITGCDSGFGLATAVHLDSIGVPVFAGCYTEDGVNRLKDKNSPTLIPFQLDVSREFSVQEAYKFVLNTLAKMEGVVLWGLVNNAGILGNISPIDMLSPGDYQKVMEINFQGLVNMTLTFLPVIKRSGGRVVNVSSVAGLVAFDRFSPYTASKFAIQGFSDSTRMELQNWGVKVSVVEPTWFSTDLAVGDQLAAKFKESWEKCPTSVKIEYGRFYYEEVMWKLMQPATYKLPTDVSPVVKAYEHALFSEHPKSHYTVGRGWWFFLLLAYYLPRVISEWILRRLPGSGRPVPKALQPKHQPKLY